MSYTCMTCGYATESAIAIGDHACAQPPASEPSHPCDYPQTDSTPLPTFGDLKRAMEAQPAPVTAEPHPSGDSPKGPGESMRQEFEAELAQWKSAYDDVNEQLKKANAWAYALEQERDTARAEVERLREALGRWFDECGDLHPIAHETLLPKVGDSRPTAAYEQQRDVSADDEFMIEYLKQQEEQT